MTFHAIWIKLKLDCAQNELNWIQIPLKKNKMQIAIKDWKKFNIFKNNIICVKACIPLHFITLAMVGKYSWSPYTCEDHEVI
jgi:hypothetical protein